MVGFKGFLCFQEGLLLAFASQPQAKILALEVRIGSGEQLAQHSVL